MPARKSTDHSADTPRDTASPRACGFTVIGARRCRSQRRRPGARATDSRDRHRGGARQRRGAARIGRAPVRIHRQRAEARG